MTPAPEPVGGPTRELDIRVEARPENVAEVRRELAALGLPAGALADARLLVSEFVTNAVRHSGLGSGDLIRVHAVWSGTRLRVDVHDRPVAEEAEDGEVVGAIRPSPGAESGWGLYLVDRIATRWGRAPGRHWLELEVEPGGDVPAPG
jgi:anti-sigma regulatory factor (Ser/Thr protein kinase)